MSAMRQWRRTGAISARVQAQHGAAQVDVFPAVNSGLKPRRARAGRHPPGHIHVPAGRLGVPGDDLEERWICRTHLRPMNADGLALFDFDTTRLEPPKSRDTRRGPPAEPGGGRDLFGKRPPRPACSGKDAGGGSPRCGRPCWKFLTRSREFAHDSAKPSRCKRGTRPDGG